MKHRFFQTIAIFIPSLEGGGAERVVANLANHWAGTGKAVTVVTFASRCHDFYVLHPNVERICLRPPGGEGGGLIAGLWRNFQRILTMRQVLHDIQPDIALGIMTIPNVLLALATVGLRIRAIGSEHIHPPQCPLGPLREMLRRFAYGRLYAVTALTNESALWLNNHTRVRQVRVIPNAAPWPLLMQEPRVNPQSVCLPGRNILLAAGRFESQKGFDLLLNAFADVAKIHTVWDLVIIGEGSLRATLEAYVKAVGLNVRVFLPGLVGNIGEWYERADIFVMSSRFEGFGNTLAEALTYGLPALSFDCDAGPRDIIRDEIDGLLVPPGNVAALSAALCRLMGDGDLRQRLAERSVDARERFSIGKIAGMWEQLFEEQR